MRRILPLLFAVLALFSCKEDEKEDEVIPVDPVKLRLAKADSLLQGEWRSYDWVSNWYDLDGAHIYQTGYYIDSWIFNKGAHTEVFGNSGSIPKYRQYSLKIVDDKIEIVFDNSTTTRLVVDTLTENKLIYTATRYKSPIYPKYVDVDNVEMYRLR